jgi:hypothetical protein
MAAPKAAAFPLGYTSITKKIVNKKSLSEINKTNMEIIGLEPITSDVQSQRSTN